MYVVLRVCVHVLIKEKDRRPVIETHLMTCNHLNIIITLLLIPYTNN